jgi:hypothetical protein
MLAKPGLFVFILFAVSVGSLTTSGQPVKYPLATDQKKLAEEAFVANLIFEARSQTPEIAADALITIAESGRITDAKLTREILEEAFNLAGQAQHTVRIDFFGPVDNKVSSTLEPLGLKLDNLSLRARVIKVFLRFDKARARRLFLAEMPPELNLPSLGCENAVRSYRLSDYYETASLVFRETFSAKERAAPGFAYILLPFVDRITSPAQIDPVAKMIAALKLSPIQLSMLSAAYAQVLNEVGNDDLTFRISIQNYQGVKDLIKAVDDSKGNSAQIVNALRGYVLKQLNGIRCSDGLKRSSKEPLTVKYELPKYIQTLNDELLKTKPINPEEIDPEKIVKTTKPINYWEGSKKSSDRLDAIRKLRFNRENLRTDEEKSKPGWLAELDQYILDLGNWAAEEEESPQDYFNKKASLFLGLLSDCVPKGPAWNSVFREYLLFLNRYELRGEGRLQWFWHIRYMLTAVVGRAEGDERARIVDMIRGFKNPAINLYCDLMRLKGGETPAR